MITKFENLKSITCQAHPSLFRLMPDLYAREEIPTHAQIHEWFKHTQPSLDRANPSVTNNAFLHLAFFDIQPPFWWISAWQHHMLTHFNHISIIDLINGLFACALLNIAPKRVNAFLEKCAVHFHEKGKNILSNKHHKAGQRLHKAAQHFETKNIHLLSRENLNALLSSSLSLNAKKIKALKEIRRKFHEVFNYPPMNPLFHKYQHKINESWKHKIYYLEEKGSLTETRWEELYTFNKSKFDRYQIDPQIGEWNDEISDFMSLELVPFVTSKERKFWERNYYSEEEEAYNEYKKNLDKRTSYIYFVRDKDYFHGHLKRELAYRFETMTKNKNIIFFNLDTYKSLKEDYLIEFLSFMMDRDQIKARIIEYSRLMIVDTLSAENNRILENLYNEEIWINELTQKPMYTNNVFSMQGKDQLLEKETYL